MKSLRFSFLLVFFTLFSSDSFCESAEDYSNLFVVKDCPIFSIRADVEFLNKKAISYGQGWYFRGPTLTGNTTIKSNLPNTENYILTPYHVIAEAKTIKAQCPYSDKNWDLEIVGSSSTYDLAVLKIVNPKTKGQNFHQFNHQPLFDLNSEFQITQINYPLDQKMQTSMSTEGKRGNSGIAFVFTTQVNNHRSLMWTSAGPILKKMSDDFISLAPFTKAITPLSGVQPGMSGGLLMSVNPQSQLLGMILGVKYNRGQSMVAPIDEILQQLPYLFKDQDPQRLKNVGTNTFVKFITNFDKNQFNRVRQLYLPESVSLSKTDELLAADLCSSSQFSDNSLVGGATTGDMGGGATVGDGSGTSSWSNQYSVATFDWMQILDFKRFHIRGIFQREDLCDKEGVIWIPLTKTLVGVRTKTFMMTINSVRDLIYLEENIILNKKFNPEGMSLITWINSNGIFKEDNLNFGHRIINSFCSQPQNIVKDKLDGLLKGTNLLISMPETASSKIKLSRIYEDYIALNHYSEFPQGFANKFGPGYFCEDNYFLIVGTNLNFIYDSERFFGNSYLVKIEFHPKYFNFHFDTYYKNGEEQKNNPELTYKSLKKEKILYNNLLNHFFEIDGFKFYLRLIPEQAKIELSLIGMPKNDSSAQYLMASQGETKIPLAGFNFVYTLQK